MQPRPTFSLSLPSDFAGWDLRLDARLERVRTTIRSLDQERLPADQLEPRLRQLWQEWSGVEQRSALQEITASWRGEWRSFGRYEEDPREAHVVRQANVLTTLMEYMTVDSAQTGVVWDPRWDVLRAVEWLDQPLPAGGVGVGVGVPGASFPSDSQVAAHERYQAQVGRVGQWAAGIGDGDTVRSSLSAFRSLSVWKSAMAAIPTPQPADVAEILDRLQFEGLVLLLNQPSLDTPAGSRLIRDLLQERITQWHQQGSMGMDSPFVIRSPMVGRGLDEGRTWPGFKELLERLVRHGVSFDAFWDRIPSKSPLLHTERMTPLMLATAQQQDAMPARIIQSRPSAGPEAWAATMQHPAWRPHLMGLLPVLSGGDKQPATAWPQELGFDPAATSLLESSGVYHYRTSSPTSWARMLAQPGWTREEVQQGLTILLERWPTDIGLRAEALANLQTEPAWAAEVFLVDAGEVTLREVVAHRADLLADGRVRQVLMQSTSLNVLENLTLHAPDTASFNLSLSRLIKRDLPSALRVLEQRELCVDVKLRSSLLRPFLVHEERGVKTRAIQALGRWQAAGAVEAGTLSVTEKKQARGRLPSP